MPLIAGACVIAPGGAVTGVGLAKAIAEACSTPNPPGATTESALQQFSNLLALAIVEHIVTNATVTVLPGIAVVTAGTAVAQTGATTSPGTGTVL
jgi:hypothetical protein